MRHKLRQLRVNKKLTQEQIAQKVGIDRAYYTNIELGNKNPSFKVAVKIKKVLNCNDDDIFLDV